MEDNYIKLNKALQKYILNTDENLVMDLLEYIQNRILANENEIKDLLLKTEVSFEQIVEVVKKQIEQNGHYKDYTKIIINKENFLSTSLKYPVGVIAVEVFDTLEVVKYYIKALKSKNAIVISDIEYNEYNVKSLILLIIKEALNKFGLDENLIMLLPYEDCFYQYFDKVIYTHDESGNILNESKLEDKLKNDKKYVYLENEEFKAEAMKNEEAEILKGNIDDVLEKIKFSKGATIYTKDSNLAYKFINLAKCENVFVNTNLVNIKETKKCNDVFYEYRNIIIPIPQGVLIKNENIDLEINNKEFNSDELNTETKELMVIENENIFIRFRKWLNKLFRR